MSTTPQTPSDPQAMPLADLKTAAGLDPAAQPVAAPAPPPPPAPVVPEPFSVSQDDSGVTIQMAPEFGGEVFKGKDWAEVGPKIAKAKADANAYIKQLKTQPQPQVIPPKEEPAAVDPAVQATRDWLISEQAAAFGMPVDEYRARVAMVFNTTEKMATNIAVADFHTMCPGYTDTPENSAALGSYFPEDFGRFPNAQELKQAYALAVLDGKITPTNAQPQPAAPRPPVMPSAGGSVPSGDQNAWSMPLDQLKKEAGLG